MYIYIYTRSCKDILVDLGKPPTNGPFSVATQPNLLTSKWLLGSPNGFSETLYLSVKALGFSADFSAKQLEPYISRTC